MLGQKQGLDACGDRESSGEDRRIIDVYYVKVALEKKHGEELSLSFFDR